MSRGTNTVGASAVAAALVLAVAATGCSSSDHASAGGETLASFMGWEEDDATEAELEARWRDEAAEVQERIRACMAEQGFEYIPVDDRVGTIVVADEQDEEERVRTEGFGITTWYDQLDTVDEAVVEEAVEDPNWELVEAMSEAEQEAYYAALYGSPEEQMEHATTDYDPDTGEEIGVVYEGFGGGCDGEAHEAVYGGSETQELWDELGPAFDDLYARVAADPRIVEWNEDWSRCMADAGYDYASPEALHETVWDDLQARLDAIVGADGGWVDPFEGWSEDEVEAFFNERSEAEVEAFFQQADQDRRDAVDREALSALQQEEIDLAVADYECRDGEAFWELYEEVSREYEGEFIAENRELLEQLRESER